MEGHCCHQFVIEGDGEVYPCDFYCLDCYDMGNINDTDFFALSKHPVAIEFIKESMIVEDKCKGCNFYHMCRNGCKRERVPETGLTRWCGVHTAFFEYAYPRMREMAKALQKTD